MESSSLDLQHSGGLGNLGALERGKTAADVTQVGNTTSTSGSSSLGLDAPVVCDETLSVFARAIQLIILNVNKCHPIHRLLIIYYE